VVTWQFVKAIAWRWFDRLMIKTAAAAAAAEITSARRCSWSCLRLTTKRTTAELGAGEQYWLLIHHQQPSVTQSHIRPSIQLGGPGV